MIAALVTGKLAALAQSRSDGPSGRPFVTARLHHFLTIKVFNREPIELDKFEQRNTKLYAINKHYII